MPTRTARKTPYQAELARQKKEHPLLPQKYLRMISRDHVDLHKKGKGNYG